MTVLLLVLLWQRTPIARRRLRKRIESLERQLFPAWFEPVKTAKAIVEKKTKELRSTGAGYTLTSILKDFYLPPVTESLGPCPKCGGRLLASLFDDTNPLRDRCAYINVRCVQYQDATSQIRYIDPSSINFCRGYWAAKVELPLGRADSSNPDVLKGYLEQTKWRIQQAQHDLTTLLDTERGLNGSI